MKKYFHISIILIVCCLACHEKDEEEVISGSFLSENYVQVYIDTKDVQLTQFHEYIEFIFNGNPIDNWTSINREQFDRLSSLYHDKEYNRKLVPFSNKALSDPLEDISVTSDVDFDGFPQGKIINELVDFYATTPYLYILNNYNTDIGSITYVPDTLWDMSFERTWGYSFILKKISDLTIADVTLLNPVCYMKLSRKPVNDSESVNLMINFRLGDKLFQKEFHYNFK